MSQRDFLHPLTSSLNPVVRLGRALSGLILPEEPTGGLEIWSRRRDQRWLSYIATLGLVAVITSLGFLIEQRIAPTNLAMLYLLAVMISALRWGLRQAVVCALAGAAAFNFFFIPPYRTFAFTDIWYFITLITLVGIGLVISTLASQAREQAERARKREAFTEALYSLNQSLTGTSRLEQILDAVGRNIVEAFRCSAIVLLPSNGELVVRFCSPKFHFDEAERKLATWAFEHGQKAGHTAGTLSSARSYYLPLKTAWEIEGVLGVQAGQSGAWLAPEHEQVLEVLASRAALAIERAILEEKTQQAQLLQETDRLQKTLLNTISHNLRTPLASITGTLGSLLEDITVLDDTTRNELLENAYEQAMHLNRLVGNLLDMTRLEAGAVHVKTELGDVQDVVGAALAQLGGVALRRKIVPIIPADVPLAPMDFVLITQVLVNLLDNALKYSPPDRPIEIEARPVGDYLEILVSDHGPGIAETELERVFERFNRGGRMGRAGGLGLGLSICKGFVEAHGGRIWANRRAEGGTIITFTLPVRSRATSQETDHERARTTGTGS